MTAPFQRHNFKLKIITLLIDRNSNGGGLLVYVRQDIPSKLLTNVRTSENLEILFLELNLRKRKWLICCSYDAHKSSTVRHTKIIRNYLDSYSSKYENLILLGDFNSEPTEPAMSNFYQIFVKEATCSKNPEKPPCIDLILTNRTRCFQNTNTIESGLSDFHKMITSVMKIFFQNQEPDIVRYRYYKKRFATTLFDLKLQKR